MPAFLGSVLSLQALGRSEILSAFLAPPATAAGPASWVDGSILLPLPKSYGPLCPGAPAGPVREERVGWSRGWSKPEAGPAAHPLERASLLSSPPPR